MPLHLMRNADRRLFRPEDGTGTGTGTPPPDPAAGAAPPADAPAGGAPATPPAPAGGAKWYEALSETQRAYLTPKGLTVDDPMQALPKLVDIAANAEKRIGKGLDSIIDRPAKGQEFGDWARANAEVLGLPADVAAYEVKPPQDWPKDLPWDGRAEAMAREIAFKHGIPKAAHEAYVGLQAQLVLELDKAATEGLEKARAEMKAELSRDWGPQLEAKLTGARQAMQFLAEKAGIGTDGIEALAGTLSDKVGDAGVMRIFATLSELMADDTGFAMGRGQQSLGMTPAEARAEIARFESPDGEYGKAVAAKDFAKLNELRARRDQLYKQSLGG